MISETEELGRSGPTLYEPDEPRSVIPARDEDSYFPGDERRLTLFDTDDRQDHRDDTSIADSRDDLAGFLDERDEAFDQHLDDDDI